MYNHAELSMVTIIILYYSSRLVLFSTVRFRDSYDGDYLTATNMLYYLVPGTMKHWLFVVLKDLENFERFLFILCFLMFHLFVPLIHFVYVVYCCFKQFQAHYNNSEDFPQFVPMSVIEIYESAPQCNS